MRKAFHATKFKSPDAGEGPEGRPGQQVPHLHGPVNLTEFEDLTTKANENLGSDLDKFHGITTFRGCRSCTRRSLTPTRTA
jgi:hypothetical protein